MVARRPQLWCYVSLTVRLMRRCFDQDSPGLDIVIHAMRLQTSAVPPVEATVVGRGRLQPRVKHSQWVVDR